MGQREGMWAGYGPEVADRSEDEQSLRDSELRLRFAIEAGKLGLWDVDLRTQKVACNEELHRNLGYERGDTQPDFAHWTALVHPADAPAAVAAFTAHQHGRTERYQAEFRMRTKSGDWKWILSRGLATERDAQGVAQRVVGVNIDIDERKRAETERTETEAALRESEERFRAAFEQAAVGMAHFAANGALTRINEKFLQMLGYSREEMIGHYFAEFTHPDDLPACNELVMALVNNQQDAFQADKRWLRKDGSALWAQMTVSTVRDADGAVRYFSTVCVDMSERQRAEAERQARQAAESASRAKSDFLAKVSHELRSPLNAILGFTRLVMQGDLPEQAKRDLAIVVSSAQHLLGLINQVLTLSRAEAGRISLDEARFDLHQMLCELEQTFARWASARGLAFAIEAADLPRHVRGDEVKLRRVLSNLVGNAVKFTPAGTVKLTIQARPAPELASITRLRFAVTDTGPGIRASELRQLFRPFTQAEAGRDTGYGIGLGLAVSRALVELMHGELEVDSQPGEGTTVRFEVPVGQANRDAIERSAERSEASCEGIEVGDFECTPRPAREVSALAKLPEDTREALAAAVIGLDIGAVERSIQSVRAIDPPLAEKLAELAEGFQYDQILACLRGEMTPS